TLSLGIYLEREVSADNAYALSAILIGIAVLSLIVAGIPMFFGRKPAQRAQILDEVHIEALRQLTKPSGISPEITVTSNGTTTHFPAGATTAIVRMNGCGKTTLVSLIAGRLTSASFELHHDVDIALQPQIPALPKISTVHQAITMVTKSSAQTDALLDAACLAPLRSIRVSTLSGGQAAQVALVLALA